MGRDEAFFAMVGHRLPISCRRYSSFAEAVDSPHDVARLFAAVTPPGLDIATVLTGVGSSRRSSGAFRPKCALARWNDRSLIGSGA